MEEAVRTGILRTDGGTSMVVYPLSKVTLGQAIVVVAGTTVFCLEVAWDGMSEDDRERFRQVAAKGARWIDQQIDIPMLSSRLTRGGRWCAHKGYSREAKKAVRDPDAVAFGVAPPSEQSAGTIVVGGRRSDTAQYCDTCGGETEASRQCSPQGSWSALDSYTIDQADKQLRQDMEEETERDADRQLREESIESDQGVEPWMRMGRQTIRGIEDRITSQYGELELGEERNSEATVRGEKKEIELHEARWTRLEKSMMDNVRENAEVRKEVGRLGTLVQEGRDERRELLEEIRRLNRVTDRAGKKANEERAVLKEWLARLGNESREGERIVSKNQAAIMEAITRMVVNHNVSREDHKSIFREIRMLETAMGSTVKGAVAEAVGRLRMELKRIFESLVEHTPRVREESRAGRGKESPGDLESELEVESTDSDTEEEKEDTAWGKGYRGTIGGRRGGREGSGGAGNPINLVTPTRTKATLRTREGRNGSTGTGKKFNRTTAANKTPAEPGMATPETTTETVTMGEKGAPRKLNFKTTTQATPDGGLESEPEPAAGMPGQWEVSSSVWPNLSPSPTQGLTSPRKDLTSETISGLRDEITIGHIANEVPMEPELSPEPEEAGPEVTTTIRYDKETAEKMLRQVEDESKRQGEADIAKQEQEMLGRVLEAGKRKGEGGEREREPTRPEEERGAEERMEGRASKTAKGKGEAGKEKEKTRKGWCDQCKEGCGERRELEDMKRREAAKGNEPRKEGNETKKGGEAVERSDWGEDGWREAGIKPTVPETPVAERGKSTKEKAGEDLILLNAPKGPRYLPRFCNLCKIHGHNDLTCHLQGNAPTPGPSRHLKPFKTIQQRTPRRGLGAPKGGLGTSNGRGEGRGRGAKPENQRIAFEKERNPTPPKEEPGLEVVRETTPDLAPRTEESRGDEKRRRPEEEEGESGAEPKLGLGKRELEKKKEKTEGQKEDERERKEEQIVKVHLRGCRAPPTAMAKGKELEWKRSLRNKVEAALKKADLGAQTSVLGTSYHFSRRNEKVVTVRVRNWTSKNEVQHIVLGATSAWEQNWTITAAVIADWVEVVVENVDGREKGRLASERAKEIARANGWKLAQRSPQWIGQNRNFDTYEGSPTGLVMTIIRRNGEPPATDCEDSPYMVFGKKTARKLKVFPLVRDGPHNFYVNEEGFKVSSRTSEHGPYAPPQWSPYKGKNSCADCGDWRHRRCGQNRRLPMCNICQGLHLDRECPRGVESREDVEKRKREIKELVREKERLEKKLKTVEEEMDERYPKGKGQDPRKHHGGNDGKVREMGNRTKGADPHHTTNE